MYTAINKESIPPLIPRKILFGNPERINPQISPDGLYLAYMAPDEKNVLQVWLQTLGQTDDRQLTKEPKRGIKSYSWTYRANQLIYRQDADGDENFHLYLVDLESGLVRDLTPFQGVKAEELEMVEAFPDEILVGLNLKNPSLFDVYRINLKNGAVEWDTENPGNGISWKADANLQVRAAIATTAEGGYDLLYRETMDKPWEILDHWGPDEEGEIVGFAADGKTLYFVGNHDANAYRLMAIDPQTGAETVMAADDQYDAKNVLKHPTKGTMEAVSFYKQREEWQVLDSSVAADFEAIAKVRRGDYSIISRNLADSCWLVAYQTDDGPVYYYSYDRASKTSTLLFSDRPQLEDLPLAPMQSISYQARDGLTIEGYLTLPMGDPGPWPAVMLVHGGPWGRDVWGYNPQVQWLANRGYAVLQVNYRGSGGYGKDFLNASNREWGGAMQDDLIDGVNWLVDRGIADKSRIGIMGTSYGGYATLVGLTFTPEVFACGVDIVGPSNLVTMIESFPPYWKSLQAMLVHRVGDWQTEPEFLKSRSPLFFADRITKPLLIGHGAKDPRVKQAESEQIVEAMRQAGKEVKYILYTDEGHGFARPENRLHFYAIAEEFMAEQLEGRFEPTGKIPGHAGVIK
ncbi:MAG: alpha/beta fold hydrolase [Hormoscilla sp.]